MATITGKRFQITDGASTPTNLFPYTVSEAVYGLSNTISNAISSALSALSLSTYAGTSAIGSSTQPVYYNGSALVATDLSTTYAPYNANGYLPLNGGTLTGKLTMSARIDMNNEVIEMGSGMLGAYSSANPRVLYWYNGSGWQTVWHAGNSNLSTVPWACSTLTASGAVSAKATTQVILSLARTGNNYAAIEFLGYADGTNDVALGRIGYSPDGAWVKDASDTAYRYIYHQGNANKSDVAWACSTLTASGNIQANAGVTIANNQSYGGLDTDGTRRTLLNINSSNQVFIAYGASAAGYTTTICGKDISFNYGTSHASGMYLNSSGNVGIGTTSPSYKLDVNGTTASSYFKATQTGHVFSDSAGRYVISADGGSYMIFGYGNMAANNTTYIDGNTIKFRCGTSYNNALTITSTGVVQITNTASQWPFAIGTDYNNTTSTLYAGLPNYGLYIGSSVSTGTTYLLNVCAGESGHGTGGTSRFYVRADGNVGIGTASPSQKLHVVGNIVATGAITAGSASDARLKTNIQSLSADAAKRIVMALNPVTFTWNEKATELYNQYKGDDLGMIAQEVEPYLPKAVGTIFEKYKRLDYTKLISPLVKVAQDHESRIRQLEAENRELRKEVERLRMN